MTDEIEPHENTLSIEELRREVRRGWDLEYAIRDALRDKPLMPPGWILKFLGGAGSFPEDWERGKQLQQEHRDAIPYKTECEMGASVWERIRRGLIGDGESAKKE